LDALQLAADTQRDAVQCFDLFGAPLTRLLEERVPLAHRARSLHSSAGGTGSNSGSSSAAAAGDVDAAVSVNGAKTLESVAGHLVTSGVLLQALAANLERYQVSAIRWLRCGPYTLLRTNSISATCCFCMGRHSICGSDVALELQ
jgi:hypothetical protein